MILEAYFDDSSDQHRSKYYACGGTLGSADQWDLFEVLWSIETGNLKEPVRSSDCECGQGQFENWTKPDRDSLMKRLVEITDRVGLYGYAAVVPISDSKEAFPDLEIKEAFRLVATQVIFNMAVIANDVGRDAKLWFESGLSDGSVLNAFKSVRGLDWKPNRRLLGINFRDKTLRALQAADLVAGESFKHMDNFGVRQPRKPVHELSERLIFMCWTLSTLKYIGQKGWPNEMEFLVKIDDELPESAKLRHFWKGSLRKQLDK